MAKTQRFVFCVNNGGAAEELQVRRVYRVLTDTTAAKRGLMWVIDDSGEDYLYPAGFFLPISLPRGAARLFETQST